MPRNNEDGVSNGPSVYWAEKRSALEALEGHCELCGRHLVSFRECSVEPPATIEPKDTEDESHWFILNFPTEKQALFAWAKKLASESNLKMRCNDKKIVEELADPEIVCTR